MKVTVYQDKNNRPVFNKSEIDMCEEMVEIGMRGDAYLKLYREGGHLLMRSMCPILMNRVVCMAQEDYISEFECTLIGSNPKDLYVTLEKEKVEEVNKELFLHRHDFFEFVFLLSGKITHYIGEDIVEQHLGEVLLVDNHTVHAEGWGEDYQAIYITLTEEKIQKLGQSFKTDNNFSRFLKESQRSLGSCNHHMMFRPIGNTGVVELLGQIYAEVIGVRQGYEYIIWGLLIRLVSLLNDQRYYDSMLYWKRGEQEKQMFYQIQHFLEEQNGNVKVEDLVKKFHYNYSYFNEIVKKYTDYTFTEFRQLVRLKKAKELLLNTQLSVREIVHKVGYENRVYFYRVFRDETGLTPQNYRMQYGEKKEI